MDDRKTTSWDAIGLLHLSTGWLVGLSVAVVCHKCIYDGIPFLSLCPSLVSHRVYLSMQRTRKQEIVDLCRPSPRAALWEEEFSRGPYLHFPFPNLVRVYPYTTSTPGISYKQIDKQIRWTCWVLIEEQRRRCVALAWPSKWKWGMRWSNKEGFF